MARLPTRIRIPAPEVERRIHATLVDERAKREAPNSGSRLHLSQIGKCERALWAMAHGISEDPPEAKMLAIFEAGRVLEDHVIDLLLRAGYPVKPRDESGQQFRVVAFDGQASGRLDGKVKLGRKSFEDRDAILETKSAKRERYEELEKIGYEEWSADYADTIHAYMGFSGIHEALVVVYCKDDSRIYAELVRFDPDRFEVLRKKAHRALLSDSLLPRPAEATSESCNYCKWCRYREWCWSPLREVTFDA